MSVAPQCDTIPCHNQNDKTHLVLLDLAVSPEPIQLRPQLIGYARVSTLEQKLDLQTDAFKVAGCEKWFSDIASGARDARPGLAQALASLRPGDTLVVWKLDRLGRSLSHLVNTVNALAARGVNFRSLQENIDTSTASGRMVFGFCAVLAEFERELIRERTNAGLESARARGRKGGRKPALSGEQVELMARLAKEGVPVSKIAELLGISQRSFFRYMKKRQTLTG